MGAERRQKGRSMNFQKQKKAAREGELKVHMERKKHLSPWLTLNLINNYIWDSPWHWLSLLFFKVRNYTLSPLFVCLFWSGLVQDVWGRKSEAGSSMFTFGGLFKTTFAFLSFLWQAASEFLTWKLFLPGGLGKYTHQHSPYSSRKKKFCSW